MEYCIVEVERWKFTLAGLSSQGKVRGTKNPEIPSLAM